MWNDFSHSTIKTLFVLDFWYTESDVLMFRFLWVYSTLSLLSFLDVQINAFIRFWKFFSHYFFTYSFCLFLPLIPSGSPIMCIFNGVPLISEATFIFFFISLFFVILRLDNLNRPNVKLADFFSIQFILQRNLSSEFFVLLIMFVSLGFLVGLQVIFICSYSLYNEMLTYFISLGMISISSLNIWLIAYLCIHLVCPVSGHPQGVSVGFFFTLCHGQTFLFLYVSCNFLLKTGHFKYYNVIMPIRKPDFTPPQSLLLLLCCHCCWW